MNKKLIIQATQAGHTLDLPPNIGKVMEDAEHWNINDSAAFHDLMQYLEFGNVAIELTKSTLLYFKDMPNRDACNVSMILKTADLDFDWVKEQVGSAAFPSFFMFAYSAELDMWHTGSLTIGRGAPTVVLHHGTPLGINWLDTDPHPPLTPQGHRALQHALGTHLWFTLAVMQESHMIASKVDGNQINIGITAHGTHSTAH